MNLKSICVLFPIANWTHKHSLNLESSLKKARCVCLITLSKLSKAISDFHNMVKE